MDNLSLLNADPNCIGEYKWESREQKRAIYYVFTSLSMYPDFLCMDTDEEKQLSDLSDHNLLTARFKIRNEQMSDPQEKQGISYFYTTKETLRNTQRKSNSKTGNRKSNKNICT